MNHPVISPKKLIEVALPLDAINTESTRRKRKAPTGYPTAFHKWWAQRPLAAARAVIFAQLVNDPEDLWRCIHTGKEPNQQERGHWTKTRARLFSIIEDLIMWENSTNDEVLNVAREQIRKSWQEVCELNKDHPDAPALFNASKMPGLHDPFAGGGSIPLESQRLGLDTLASDLNPVSVLINKAMIEIPPRFRNRPPVNAVVREDRSLIARDWTGAFGMAEDVRYYANWIKRKATDQIGHLYPPIVVTKAMAEQRPDLHAYIDQEIPVVAWLWVRTVKSPNPAFSHVDIPLASSFVVSNKIGKEAYVKAIVSGDSYVFTVKMGKPPVEAKEGTTAGSRAAFRCLMSDVPVDYAYIRNEAQAGRMGQKLMAIVAEGKRGRLYLPPTKEHEAVAQTQIKWKPTLEITPGMSERVVGYGIRDYSDLFTLRQLAALTTFADLIVETRDQIRRDALSAGFSDDDRGFEEGGDGADSYADAISVYLAMVHSRMLHYSSTACLWLAKDSAIARTFTKQALPMTWDFAEGNVFEKSSAQWKQCANVVSDCIEFFPANASAVAFQANAASSHNLSPSFISTDPPYFDNIGYADLSDFFYVWLRSYLRPLFPNLFSTITVPKAEELVATPHRHGSKIKAELFFLNGMTQAMQCLASYAHPSAPITIYYAFKQTETKSKEGTSSNGWDTFLDAVLKSNLMVTGTWPMRTEGDNRQVGIGKNALASSIVLVCRPRGSNAGTISRRQFIRELNATLPVALDAMTRESEGLHSPVAPVDLSQAIIGPGMAVFSKYNAVLEADGSPMTVRTALQLINRFLAEDDFDADTQFCLHWFEQYGWETGKFGEADILARAKGTSVDGVKQAGVLHAAGGNVRLLKWAEYSSDWNPQSDQRLPIWEVLHQLIRVFNTDGETGAAAVFAAVQSKAEAARQLAYRLYTLCERKNWAEDARAYNEVVTSWSGIESAAAKEPTATQRTLFDN